MKAFGTQRVSFKLARAGAILAVLIGILLAVAQVYIDLLGEEQARDEIISEILSVSKLSAERAVMRLDTELAQEVVGGLMEYDYILSVSIVDDLNEVLAEAQREQTTGSRTRAITQSLTKEYVEASIQLEMAQELRLAAGELHILVDNDQFLQSFYSRAVVILIGGLAQNLALAFLLFAAFHYMIGDPLADIAKQLDNVDPSHPRPNALTAPSGHEKDELGHVVRAANSLISAIRKLMNEQLEARKKLALARDELEYRVEERTAELQHEIRERKSIEEQLKRSNFMLEDRVEARTSEIREEIEKHKRTLVELSAMKEAADSANRAKTSFLANMSHELRTPLNAIVGFTTIMNDEMFGPLGNDRYRQYVRDIQDSGTHLSEILGNILDLAKVEAGELTLSEEKLSVEAMLQNCVKMFAVMSVGAGIKINLIVEPDVDGLWADELRVKQIVINLISNSLKFTGENGVIDVSAKTDDKGCVLISVRDNGAGIPKDQIETVLQPFAQVDASFRKTHQGVGLGLSLSRVLAEMHDGKLWIESELGEWTEVFVRFPKERAISLAEKN